MQKSEWTYWGLCSVSVFALLLSALVGCTTIEENYPTGSCEPNTKKCDGNDLVHCTAIGFEQKIVCAEEDPCHVGDDDEPTCTPAVQTTTCVEESDCLNALGDAGLCKAFLCVDGLCEIQTQADGQACDDGNECNKNTACLQGACLGQEIDCDDSNPCTTDSCDPTTGCTYEADNTAACSDGAPCTTNDSCLDGVCKAGSPKDCADDNVCTDDYCDTATGDCIAEGAAGACDDNDDCTDLDACQLGTCTGDPVCPCDLNTPCPTPTNPCDGSYVCANNYCVVDTNASVKCSQDDLNPCQLSVCQNVDGVAECQNLAISTGTVCDDGDECTINDQCQSGQCSGAPNFELPDCSHFQLRSWFISPSAPTGDPSTHQFRATIGYPQIIGTAENDLYRVRAFGLQSLGETE
jgi:hypothetical protein